ncbi:hypothetical protein D3C87_1886800 [compost metagenome]
MLTVVTNGDAATQQVCEFEARRSLADTRALVHRQRAHGCDTFVQYADLPGQRQDDQH